ncbi:hypothetical protein [Planococcus shenhongbingii]|uniref:Ferric siderophore reductase C-terminal domain-containing protein n=1 Tax=Planococcus shenhongbingii TaxID=3058398 RepID=A0ABT8NAJ3_9BACL|nr:hypothetical protein [Planococcus sp. N017]MDN7244916.1 hypothetical protein [Planococcus sp. N017]
MEFPAQLKYTLASQSIAVDRPPAHPLSPDFKEQINEIKQWSGTQNNGVAVSYFFRQYALFISAQFDLLTNHNGYFACSWKDLQFSRIHNYGFNLLQTHVDSHFFTSVSRENRFEAMHFVLCRQVADLIDEFRKHVKISPIILWENVLGSVLWFYATLQQHAPRRAAEDIEWLLESANWKPIKASYLYKLMGTASLEQAVSGPLRKTCCLYKELPAFSTCTFCPQPH